MTEEVFLCHTDIIIVIIKATAVTDRLNITETGKKEEYSADE